MALGHINMETNTKIIERADIFVAISSVNLSCLAAEKIADKAAAGEEVEGDLADLLFHLRTVAGQLDRAIG